ncbi:MAG TPA: hypothetical protein VMY18_09480, partial [Acidobacteriota bacterium]|nr:hypothetical protein [Acidobacteriota bacterium]
MGRTMSTGIEQNIWTPDSGYLPPPDYVPEQAAQPAVWQPESGYLPPPDWTPQQPEPTAKPTPTPTGTPQPETVPVQGPMGVKLEEPEGRELEFRGTIYKFGPEYSDESIKREFEKLIAPERELAPEQAGGRSLPIDAENHTQIRSKTPLDKKALKEYAELFSGEGDNGKPVVVKPEDVTPQLLTEAIKQRKEFAEKAAKNPLVNRVWLRNFNEDTASMESDQNRRWTNETTMENYVRTHLNKMSDKEVIEWAKDRPGTKT